MASAEASVGVETHRLAENDWSVARRHRLDGLEDDEWRVLS